MEHLRDEELVQKCLSGEVDAFSYLVKRYEKQIFSLAYRISHDYDEAADLTQEAFIRIYDRLSLFDTEKRFFPWMYRVARNVCVSEIAKRKPPAVDIDEYVGVLEDGNAIENQPEANYGSQELRQVIDEAIEALPEKYREPVFLRYVEELSYADIAKLMDVPVSTVETRLFRGRKLLQTNLEKYFNK